MLHCDQLAVSYDNFLDSGVMILLPERRPFSMFKEGIVTEKKPRSTIQFNVASKATFAWPLFLVLDLELGLQFLVAYKFPG